MCSWHSFAPGLCDAPSGSLAPVCGLSTPTHFPIHTLASRCSHDHSLPCYVFCFFNVFTGLHHLCCALCSKFNYYTYAYSLEGLLWGLDVEWKLIIGKTESISVLFVMLVLCIRASGTDCEDLYHPKRCPLHVLAYVHMGSLGQTHRLKVSCTEKTDSSRQDILYVDLVLYARMLAQSSHADFSRYICKWKL